MSDERGQDAHCHRTAENTIHKDAPSTTDGEADQSDQQQAQERQGKEERNEA